MIQVCAMNQSKVPFIPSESDRKSEKDQRTSEGDQRKNIQTSKKIFTFSFPFTWCEWVLMQLGMVSVLHHCFQWPSNHMWRNKFVFFTL